MTDPAPEYVKGEKPVVMVQNPSTYNPNNSSYDFIFVIDTCDNLKDLTGSDCKTEAESQDVLNEVKVSTRIQTQFWNTKNFLRNGWEMNS